MSGQLESLNRSEMVKMTTHIYNTLFRLLIDLLYLYIVDAMRYDSFRDPPCLNLCQLLQAATRVFLDR